MNVDHTFVILNCPGAQFIMTLVFAVPKTKDFNPALKHFALQFSTP